MTLLPPIRARHTAVAAGLLTLLAACRTSDVADTELGPPERLSDGRWTESYAADWWAAQPQPVGFNYVPQNAINQLEMWQVETFDPARIELELIWAEEMGFNTLRVFLHDLVWTQDPDAFVERIDHFLEIADAHGFTTLLVLFDHVWDPEPALGTQPEPIPGVHNSGWVHSPSKVDTLAFAAGDPEVEARLEAYVTGVVSAFADDPRVLMWDTINEAGSTGIGDDAIPLVEATFGWISAVAPIQPATASVYGTWQDETLQQLVVDGSDIPSFHSYFSPQSTTQYMLNDLEERSSRPLICTEYMARPLQSTFEGMMPYLRERNIGAIHWGFVAGKTQTYYSWLSQEGDPEPSLWFHDVVHPDGTPYDEAEVAFIRDFLAP